jgi:hypothetical protein
LQLPLKSGWQKIPSKHRHGVCNPTVPRRGVPPEVLVGIDFHEPC